MSSCGSESAVEPPTPVAKILKDVDQWSFNVFDLDEHSGGNSLRYMGYELIRSQGLISKLRVRVGCLIYFVVILASHK